MAAKQHGYVNSEYLSAAAQLFAPIKSRSYHLMGDIAGKAVLDIGCGSGVDTIAMAALVGGAGSVHGVDFDADMIRCADDNVEHASNTAHIQHQCADAYQLPFANDSFSATRSERLFMHLAEPQRALQEAVRVTQPGGVVVLVDTDWGSLSAHTGANDIERRVAQFRAERFLSNGYSGRRLYALMSAAGLANIETETVALHTKDLALWQYLTLAESVAELAVEEGALSRAEATHWRQAMEMSYESQAFFGSVNIVLACGLVNA